MPIYEYWCPSCKREFEQMRPMSKANEPAPCPTCGTASEKLPSVFASGSGYTIKVPAKDALRQRQAPQSTGAQAS